MATRTEREKNKKQHDKHTAILMELLREDQNKYCADCRAKGPRWASWNLGIFVCITCAGIHRNLGVHISKVKSVNLDAWTPEQVKNVQEWGNRRAADYYEYHLPNGFKRPHGDSSLEQFIRNKYEKKLYINKGGPPPPREAINSPEKVGQEKKKSSENKKISRPEPTKTVQNAVKTINAPSSLTPSATADLLSLSAPVAPAPQQAPQQNNTLLSMSSSNTADLLNFGDSSFQTQTNNVPQQASQGFAFELTQNMSTPTAPVPNTAPTSNGVINSSGETSIEENLFKDEVTSGGQSQKDSIMALYQPSQKQATPQMFGVPGGVYLQQQQQQQQMNVMAMNRPRGMAPQYNAHFTSQQAQQQMYQVNQVQQQMAMLGFGQQSSTQAMPNNRAMPNVQAGTGYNYQVPPGMTQYNNGPTPYGNTPMVNGGWMPRPPGSFPQQQPTPQYVTTGPSVPRFNMFQGQGGIQSGHTLSTNLWK